nr:hypothetical protein [uncultured Sphingomonas sp.]
MTKISSAVVLCALALAGCSGGLESKAREALSGSLKDVRSAEFRNLTESSKADENGVRLICGEVNAKNAFGAYTGFKKFMVPSTGGEAMIADDPGTASVLDLTIPRLCS